MAAKSEFKLPYAGIAADGGYDLLFGLNGVFSVVISLKNPVEQYAASPETYDDYNYLLKQAGEYLQNKYNEHFSGRVYTEVRTYLTITRQVRKGAFYVYDQKAL